MRDMRNVIAHDVIHLATRWRHAKVDICSGFLTRCAASAILRAFSPTGISRGPPGLRPRGFSFSGVIVNRCVFLVDGLNLYHSLLDAERATGRSLRSLDVASLCRSYVHTLPGRSTITTIDYFSAVAHHREAVHPSTVARQVAYSLRIVASIDCYSSSNDDRR